MHALAGQRIQIGGERGDQGLALARLHLGDVALVQEHRALQLHVEGPQPQCPPCAFAAVGKRLGQDRIQAFPALLHPLLELPRLGDDPVIGQRLEVWLQRVDLRHDRTDGLYRAVVRGAEHLPRKRSHSQHVFSEASDSIVWPLDLPGPATFHRRAKYDRTAPFHATVAM